MILKIKEFIKDNAALLLITFLTFAGALSRLLPHPMNFTPLTALALLGAFYFKKSWQSILIPLAALFLSDIFIGFYSYMWVVYCSFFCITMAGLFLKTKNSFSRKLGVVFPSTLFFFFTTNSAVFYKSTLYPQTLEGYLTCLAAGIPFLKNALAGDLFYGIILFGTAELIQKTLWVPNSGLNEEILAP